MLEGLIQSYFSAFGRGWAPRDELAYVMHESRRARSQSKMNAATGMGSGYATRPGSEDNDYVRIDDKSFQSI
jgi:hypothetical protein